MCSYAHLVRGRPGANNRLFCIFIFICHFLLSSALHSASSSVLFTSKSLWHESSVYHHPIDLQCTVWRVCLTLLEKKNRLPHYVKGRKHVIQASATQWMCVCVSSYWGITNHFWRSACIKKFLIGELLPCRDKSLYKGWKMRKCSFEWNFFRNSEYCFCLLTTDTSLHFSLCFTSPKETSQVCLSDC